MTGTIPHTTVEQFRSRSAVVCIRKGRGREEEGIGRGKYVCRSQVQNGSVSYALACRRIGLGS